MNLKSEPLLAGGWLPFHNLDVRGFALSKDGTLLAYELPNRTELRLRNLVTGHDDWIPGTEDLRASFPFFSPDGGKIGFLHDEALKTITVSGGPPRILVPSGLKTTKFKGADCSRDGQIVFANRDAPLRMVPEEGGEVRDLTSVSNPTTGGQTEVNEFPHFLDDGRLVAFRVRKLNEDASSERIEVINAVTKEQRTLDLQSSSRPAALRMITHWFTELNQQVPTGKK